MKEVLIEGKALNKQGRSIWIGIPLGDVRDNRQIDRHQTTETYRRSSKSVERNSILRYSKILMTMYHADFKPSKGRPLWWSIKKRWWKCWFSNKKGGVMYIGHLFLSMCCDFPCRPSYHIFQIWFYISGFSVTYTAEQLFICILFSASWVHMQNLWYYSGSTHYAFSYIQYIIMHFVCE